MLAAACGNVDGISVWPADGGTSEYLRNRFTFRGPMLRQSRKHNIFYVDLVPNRSLAQRVFSLVGSEYARTCDSVTMVTQSPELLGDEPVIRRSIELRNPYVDPLNYLQVEILQKLRSEVTGDASNTSDLRALMVLTINGIAAGLRNTG